MQNQKISELYTDNNKSKYSSNSKDTIKSWKNFVKNPKPCTQLPFARQKYCRWDHKSIKFQTSNKFQDNYGLTAQFNIYNFQMNYLLYV